MGSAPRIPIDRKAWDRDFQALCEKHGADAAYYIPRVVGSEWVSAAITGGESTVCEYLDGLIRAGAAFIAARRARS